jgi:hypothetical protein
MRFVYLIALAALATAGYFYYTNEPPPPAPPPQIDPQKVKNRREVIRFYERAIMDLERSMGYRSTVNVYRPQSTNYDPYRNQVRSVPTSAHQAHRKQIEEYKRRIAVMKAEIGE